MASLPDRARQQAQMPIPAPSADAGLGKKSSAEISRDHTPNTVDDLKYQQTSEPTDAAGSDELLTLKLRYKEPVGEKSKLLEDMVKDTGASYARADEDFRFAAAVAGFGLMLRESQYKGDLTLDAVLELAQASRGADEHGYRTEFIELVKKASDITSK